MTRGKNRMLILLLCFGALFFLATASKVNDQKLDPLCQNLNICDGYTYTKMEAYAPSQLGQDKNGRGLPLPKGASYSTSIPFCSIYEYDSNTDDDAAWRCTWKKSDYYGRDGYQFTLESINGTHNAKATIKAIAVIIDTKVFKVNANWVFQTSSKASRSISSKSTPKGSITLYSVDTYYTNADDNFTFQVGDHLSSFYANTFNGNKGSYIRGRILNITPPSTMYSCSAYLELKNNYGDQWNSSRNSYCGDLKYSKQYPLVIPSIYQYYGRDNNVDKDFSVLMRSFGMGTSAGKTYAQVRAGMEDGNKDSVAKIQFVVFGYR